MKTKYVYPEDIIAAISRGVNRMKRIEEQAVPEERRKDSAWLDACFDLINRTALAIRDELIE